MSRKQAAAIIIALAGALMVALRVVDDDRARRRWTQLPEAKRRRLSRTT